MKGLKGSYSRLVSMFVAGLTLVVVGACTKKNSEVKNELNLVVGSNVKGLDPIYANDEATIIVIANLVEPLYQYNYLKRPLVVEPLSAESLPEVSKDGLVHTIKIKKNIFYSDDPAFKDGKGREMKAQDFIYGWKRLADPRNAADGYWIFDQKIKGLDDWRKKIQKDSSAFDDEIEGFKALDDYTIQIRLNVPYYQLMHVLSMHYAAPVPKEAAEKYGKEFTNHSIGTGPFILESWVRNSKFVLKKNPRYHGTYPTEGTEDDRKAGHLEDAGKKLPFVDQLTIHEINEDQPAWLKFVKGEVDISSIPKDNYSSAIKDSQLTEDFQKKGIVLYTSESASVSYLVFNMRDPLIKNNLNLRRAIGHALNVNLFIEKFLNGRGIPAMGPFPPGIEGYDEKFVNPHAAYDLKLAKEYLAKAGYPEGKGLPELDFATGNSQVHRQAAEFFQQELAAIGVKVKISMSSWPQLLEKYRDGKFQITGAGWNADYPDAENFLQLFYGKSISPGPNQAAFVNAQFDQLFQKAHLLPPGPERLKLYLQMRDIVVELQPVIFRVFPKVFALHHGWVKNYVYSTIIHGKSKYVRVDLEKKKSLLPKM